MAPYTPEGSSTGSMMHPRSILREGMPSNREAWSKCEPWWVKVNKTAITTARLAECTRETTATMDATIGTFKV